MKFNNYTRRSLLMLASLSILVAGHLATTSIYAAENTNRYYVGISGNLLMPNQDKGSFIAVSNDPKDLHAITMQPTNGTSNYAVTLSGGMRFNWERQFLPGVRLGVLYSYQNSQQHKGTIYDALQPALFANTYQYKVQSQVVLLDQAFEIIRWNNFTPYFHTGVGAANNSVSQYQSSSDSEIHTNYQFADRNATGLAYLVGIGVDYRIKRNWQVTLAYDYLNQGTVSLGKSTNPAISSPKNMLSNQIITLGVRYEFAK